jgi:site-specific recombinase XerD
MTPSTSTVSHGNFSCRKSDYATHAFEKALASEQITNQDYNLIKEFIAERKALANISIGRANKFTYTLIGWRRFLGPFADLSITDVYVGIERMKESNSSKGRPFKQNTKHDWVRILKQFLQWLIENEYTSLPEKKVNRIKVPAKDTMTKKASDLLTPDEIHAILAACYRSSDRALFGMLYEGGFRIGEIGAMRWGDLRFDNTGVVVNLNFKTGIPRYVRIIMMKKYVTQWRSDYPGTPEGDAHVFLNEQKRPITNAGVIKQLIIVCKRAGITKHVTPHLFRHSRITHLINEGVSESVIKMMMWGSVHTNMFRTYAHLTGNDIDEEMKRLYGISEEGVKKRQPRLEPRICPNCRTIMPPIAEYCAQCGENLSVKRPAHVDEIQEFVVKHPKDVKEYLDTNNS